MKNIQSISPRQSPLIWLIVNVSVVLLFSLFAVPAWSATGDYDGTYSGTFSGDDNGYWVGFVEGSAAQLIVWSTTYSRIDGDSNMTVDENGNFSGYSDVNGTYFRGTIVNSLFSGSYSKFVSDENGTITGQLESGSSQFEGTYSGNYTGDESGTWSMTIDSNGYVVGNIGTPDGTIVTLEGGVGSDGRIIAYSDVGTGIYGTVSDGSISGTWVQMSYTNGSFSSSEPTGGATGGGDDGGGCFIETLSH